MCQHAVGGTEHQGGAQGYGRVVSSWFLPLFSSFHLRDWFQEALYAVLVALLERFEEQGGSETLPSWALQSFALCHRHVSDHATLYAVKMCHLLKHRLPSSLPPPPSLSLAVAHMAVQLHHDATLPISHPLPKAPPLQAFVVGCWTLFQLRHAPKKTVVRLTSLIMPVSAIPSFVAPLEPEQQLLALHALHLAICALSQPFDFLPLLHALKARLPCRLIRIIGDVMKIRISNAAFWLPVLQHVLQLSPPSSCDVDEFTAAVLSLVESFLLHQPHAFQTLSKAQRSFLLLDVLLLRGVGNAVNAVQKQSLNIVLRVYRMQPSVVKDEVMKDNRITPLIQMLLNQLLEKSVPYSDLIHRFIHLIGTVVHWSYITPCFKVPPGPTISTDAYAFKCSLEDYLHDVSLTV